jgi:hypothetical protein
MMKKIVFIAACMTTCCAVAQDEVQTGQIALLREKLQVIGETLHYMPGNDYTSIQRWAEREKFPIVEVNAEITARALEASENAENSQKEEEKSYWRMMCSRMVSLMDASGSETFLSPLERIGVQSSDTRLRVQAVQTHVRIKGIDSLLFVRKAVDALPVEGKEYSSFRMYESLVKLAESEKDKVPKEKQETLYAFLFGVAETDANPETVAVIDDLFCKEIQGYESSRQRHTMAKRFCNVGNDWVKNKFNPIKESIDKLPEAKRTDMRQRFKQLPALKDVEEAK